MLEIILIRHGQSVANTKMLVCGQIDSELTDLGRIQGRKLQPFLENKIIPNTKIISSPLQRALETAKISVNNRNIIIEPKITELNTGTHSSLTYDEMYFIDNRFRYLSENLDLNFPNGESINQLYSRTSNWLDLTLSTIKSQQLIIFSHAYSLNCMLHHLNSLPLETYPRFILPNASAYILTLDLPFQGRKWKITKEEQFNPNTFP